MSRSRSRRLDIVKCGGDADAVTAAAREERDVRALLLEAAEAEVMERGAAGTSLRAVARRVGVSHQAPGHFFGSRVGLFTALAIYELGKLRDRLEQAAAESAHLSARDRLSHLGVAYIHFARDNHAVFSLAVGGGDLLNADDEELTAARMAAWLVLAQAVADSQAEGWRADQSLEEVGLLCWTVVHGTAIAWVEGLLTLQLPHLDLDQIAKTVTASL
jgi:AcrR family transcriptional regulator